MPPRGCRFTFPAVRFCLDYFMLKVARRRQPNLPRTALPIHSLLSSYPMFFSYSRLVHVAPFYYSRLSKVLIHSKSISIPFILLQIFNIDNYPYISCPLSFQFCSHQFIPSSNAYQRPLPSQSITSCLKTSDKRNVFDGRNNHSLPRTILPL